MRKLILGIVAVLCVQIMFQIFMAVDRSDEQHRAMMVSGLPVVPVSTTDKTVEIAGLPDDKQIAAAYVGAPIAVRRRPVKDTVRPRVARALPHTFDRVVTVAMAPMLATAPFSPQTSSDAPYLVTREAVRPEKRSLLAKAVPVIKKPYDWLKAVASRLK